MAFQVDRTAKINSQKLFPSFIEYPQNPVHRAIKLNKISSSPIEKKSSCDLNASLPLPGRIRTATNRSMVDITNSIARNGSAKLMTSKKHWSPPGPTGNLSSTFGRSMQNLSTTTGSKCKAAPSSAGKCINNRLDTSNVGCRQRLYKYCETCNKRNGGGDAAVPVKNACKLPKPKEINANIRFDPPQCLATNIIRESVDVIYFDEDCYIEDDYLPKPNSLLPQIEVEIAMMRIISAEISKKLDS